MTLPAPPRTAIIHQAFAGDHRAINELYQWFDGIYKMLSTAGLIPWTLISKTGSNLTEIATRLHNDLQTIQGGSAGSYYHLTSAQHGDLTDAGDSALHYHATDRARANHTGTQLAATISDFAAALQVVADALYAPIAHISDTTTHGTSGDIVGTSDAQTVSNKKFGGATHYSEFETDGTLHFAGDATVWKDVMFPMAPPKTSGAGNPTLTTYNGNMRGYSFAVNDVHDFDPQEMVHDSKVGSTATWHVHWMNRSNDGTDRAVKWELEYAIEPASGAIPSPTTVSVEVAITAGTAANTVYRNDVATFTIPAIARLAYARIKRIAAAGAAPSVDPILSALHFHYEADTVGSREILTK